MGEQLHYFKAEVLDLKKIKKGMATKKKLICPSCERPREDVFDHIMTIHMQVVRFRCEQYSKGFFYAESCKYYEQRCKKQE